jgi:hypothetical protein
MSVLSVRVGEFCPFQLSRRGEERHALGISSQGAESCSSGRTRGEVRANGALFSGSGRRDERFGKRNEDHGVAAPLLELRSRPAPARVHKMEDAAAGGLNARRHRRLRVLRSPLPDWLVSVRVARRASRTPGPAQSLRSPSRRVPPTWPERAPDPRPDGAHARACRRSNRSR